jgi:hypothetical protein
MHTTNTSWNWRSGGLLAVALGWLLLLAGNAQGQAASWQQAVATAAGTPGSLAIARASAVGSSGQVYVAGYFSGQITFGTTILTSAGSNDAFVARWEPSTGTWNWALASGGTGTDNAYGLAVSGSTVYVTGLVTNAAVSGDANGSSDVQFGLTGLPGTGSTANTNIFVARLTDTGAGTPPTWDWALEAGGTGNDAANALAVAGGAVYATGYTTNAVNGDANGSTDVQFGSVALTGASYYSSYDVFVARLTDPGVGSLPPAWAWALVGGGVADEQATGVAVNGGAVYVAGHFVNFPLPPSSGGQENVHFGATYLTGSGNNLNTDAFVARVTDPGTSAPTTWAWALQGGGSKNDQAAGVAVAGNAVYVAGFVSNSAVPNDPNGSYDVQFGSAALPGLGTGGSTDVFVARLTDSGSAPAWDWATQAGGTNSDAAQSLAVSGNAVYVAGYVSNYAVDNDDNGSYDVQFGATPLPGTGGATNNDAFVARLTDAGSSTAPTWAWALASGGSGTERAYNVATQGGTVYTTGYIANGGGATTFGTALGSPAGPRQATATYVATISEGTTTASWQRVQSTDLVANTALIRGTAVGSSGQVYVVGAFTGQLTLGGTRLISTGDSDLFVARWEPSSATWAWAVAGGGRGADQASSVAMSGTTLYVSGSVTNYAVAGDVNGGADVRLGNQPLSGTGATANTDAFVARLTDNGSGTPPSWNWALTGGGTSDDAASTLTVRGSAVYTAGYVTNSASPDANGSADVQFGLTSVAGRGPTLNQDLFVARLTDAGSGAGPAWDWALSGGGTANDLAAAVAVSNTTVYIAGSVTNYATAGDANGAADVQLGSLALPGQGTTANTDALVAYFTDAGAGTPPTWADALTGGGTALDAALSLTLAGTTGYVAGYVENVAASGDANGGRDVQFGAAALPGTGTTLNQDVLVARFTLPLANSPLTWDWAVQAGGTAADAATGVGLSGSAIYVAGLVSNSAASGAASGDSGVQFGSTSLPGTGTSTNTDVFVARLGDGGPTTPPTWQWALQGGGSGPDQATGLAVSGSTLYVPGLVTPAATFGSTTITGSAGQPTGLFGTVQDTQPLPVVLTAFAAVPTADGRAVRLDWATASEWNSAYFGLERSLDGTNFVSLHSVPATGSTSRPHTYTFTDAALPASVRTLYYRLRQVDLDGTAAYSPVRAVVLPGESTPTLSLFPNPASGSAILSGATARATIQVADVLGRQVLTTTADADGTARLLPAGLPAGVYLVRSDGHAIRWIVR